LRWASSPGRREQVSRLVIRPRSLSTVHVQAVYRSVHAITATRHGFFSYTASASSFRFYLAAKAPAGYRSATESMLFLLRNGRITTFVDTAKAPGLPALTYIEDASGAWAKTMPGACYYKEPRYSWGHQWVGVFGDFSPMRRSGSTIIVHSTYPYGTTGAQMSEVDRISGTSKLFLSIAGHLNGPAAFSWSMTGIREEATPSLVLAPSPHC
jgi:hypothetical protein